MHEPLQTQLRLSSQGSDSNHSVEDLCRICGSNGPHDLYVAREMMFGLRDEFDYIECASCGCVQIREIFEDMSRYYPATYYAHTTSPEKQFENPLRATVLKARARFALTGRGLLGRLLFRRLPDDAVFSLRRLKLSSETSILDVGAGTGKTLYRLKEIGFRNLLGVDPFISADMTYKNGLRVEKKALKDVSGKWDIVMLHHAFEHVPNQLEYLQQVADLLNHSGTCVIRIPTAGSYAWRHYRTDWVQLDAPRHCFLHTRESMEHLAQKAHLRVESVVYDSGDFQFVGSELYQKGIQLQHSNNTSGLFSKAQIREFQAKARELNAQGDGDAAAFYLVHA